MESVKSMLDRLLASLTPGRPESNKATTAKRDRRGTEQVTVIVGLDFGTHSTKVLMRPRGEELAGVVQIESPTQGYPWFASPSLVRLADGRLHFGGEALQRNGGTLYRSLKVHLLPPSNNDFPQVPFPAGPTPDVLVACYLSWVLGSLKKHIEARFKYSQPRVLLSMAAPMNHFENASLKLHYLGIVNAAWQSVFGSDASPTEQGVALSRVEEWVKARISREVPAKGVRPFEIMAETVAPLVSLSSDPRMEPGMYMMVDMGAGTTELSTNHVGEPDIDQKVLCYYDESIVLGGDQFARIDNQHGVDPRSKKIATNCLVGSFLKVFKKTWAMGYLKDAPNHRARPKWRQLRVLLSGGGALRPEVCDGLQSTRPMYAWPVQDTTYEVCWHQPHGIDLGKRSDSPGPIALLTVAHGLTIDRQHWPIVFAPAEVKVQQPTETIEKLTPNWHSERE